VFQVGPLELAVVAIIALIVLGPARLPDAAKAMGRGMREFKGALSGDDDDDDRERRVDGPPAANVDPPSAERPTS
jgi:sec-independent protein translocase protein TatA